MPYHRPLVSRHRDFQGQWADSPSEKEDDDTNDEIDTELDAMTVDQLLVYGNNPETFNLDLKKSLGKVAILDAIVAAEKAKGVA